MAAFVLCLALALLAAGGSAAPGSRIFGGTETTINNYPFMVALTYTYHGPGITIQRCVGGLLSSWHVLTTAYCFTGAENENFGVRAGSTSSLTGGTMTAINRVAKHPDYQEVPRIADLAIIFVSQLIFITPPITDIMFIPYDNYFIPDGQPTTVVSWGFDSNNIQLETLKYIILNKIPEEQCRQIYNNVEHVHVDERVICGGAPNVGMCAGDSGAPMVIRENNANTVVGIHTEFDACGSDDADIFTRVDKFTSWILDETTPVRDSPKMLVKDGSNMLVIDSPRMLARN